MELEDELDMLREEIATWERRNPGAHHRGELKSRVVKVARSAQECGVTTKQAAELLGLKACMLARWLRVDTTVNKIEGMLREMKVIGAEATTPATVQVSKARRRGQVLRARWPRLLAPGGLVVEGLDTEQIITILRALR